MASFFYDECANFYGEKHHIAEASYINHIWQDKTDYSPLPGQEICYITDKVTKEPLSDDGCRLAGPYLSKLALSLSIKSKSELSQR